MDADFRILIPGKLSARLLVDELAEAIEEAALRVLDSRRQQLIAQTQRGELAHAVRQQRDADAELFQFRRGFVNTAGDPPCVKIERKREPANSAADDRYIHAHPPGAAIPRLRLQPFAVILSISAMSSGLSTQSAAFTLASICSGLVAPAMMLATVGRAASHENASSVIVRPRAFTKASSFSSTSKFASSIKRAKASVARRVPGAACPRLCLPVSSPEASGK